MKKDEAKKAIGDTGNVYDDILTDAPEITPAADVNYGYTDLAVIFSRRLKEYVGDDNMIEIIRLNEAEKDTSICHCHDFCDGNQIMIDALAEINGYDPDDEKSMESFPFFEQGWNEDKSKLQLIEWAWEEARKNNFWFPVTFKSPPCVYVHPDTKKEQ